jgi:hypothetical protein
LFVKEQKTSPGKRDCFFWRSFKTRKNSEFKKENQQSLVKIFAILLFFIFLPARRDVFASG